MAQDDIEENFQYGKPFEIRGFCSSTTKKEYALNSVLSEPAAGKEPNQSQQQQVEQSMVPVLFEFVILDPMSHFQLNKSNYSAFHHEREVLLQDGLSCTMTGIKKSMNSRLGQSLTII